MKLPFTVDQFFEVFESYNRAIWPAQIVAYVLGIVAVVLALRDTSTRGRIVSAVLALFWIWMGIAYHIMHFAAVNPAARLFGAVFVLQGLIIAAVGCVNDRLRFRFVAKPIPLVGLLLVLYALIAYPLLGMCAGHSYPRAPMFGVAPCPTTIFTFGLLLWTSASVPVYVMVIPLLWSLIGTTAAANLQVPQDYGLGVAGVLGTILVLTSNRLHSGRKRAARTPEAGAGPA